jgi:hypothetical protein
LAIRPTKDFDINTGVVFAHTLTSTVVWGQARCSDDSLVDALDTLNPYSPNYSTIDAMQSAYFELKVLHLIQ